MSVISKGAQKTNTDRHPTFWYGSAREGFLDLLVNGAQIDKDHRGVLLPAYIGWSSREGSGVFDPVRQSGRSYGFYGLNRDLSADLHSLESLLAHGDFSHVVLIHYFGRTDPRSEEIYSVARKHGAVVIDDLAHGFFTAFCSNRRFGGDAQLYSLHKQFPLPEGGMIRYTGSDLLREQRSSREDLAEQIFTYDWQGIASARVNNHTVLSQCLTAHAFNGTRYEVLWPELTDGDVPQSFPVRLLDTDRNSMYFDLNERGYGATSLYHTLIQESSGLYPVVDEISRTIINLPLHQDASEQQLHEMTSLLFELIDRGTRVK